MFDEGFGKWLQNAQELPLNTDFNLDALDRVAKEATRLCMKLYDSIQKNCKVHIGGLVAKPKAIWLMPLTFTMV